MGCGLTHCCVDFTLHRPLNQHIDFQAAYIRDLVGPTDYPTFDIEGMDELFKEWKRDKEADILGYHNKSYRSTLTDTIAPPHHTPWMGAMDDPLEAFLDGPATPEAAAQVQSKPHRAPQLPAKKLSTLQRIAA